ncbi:FG-GAP repeat protein, partial [Marine Group I thaumarchaeote]|nr:FG-GAP repeat protein [Marine Group I thaumarchaeote]
MKSKPFSIFLIIILGFSLVSVSGLGGNSDFSSNYFHHSINLSEDLVLSGGFGQNSNNVFAINLDERLELFNNEGQSAIVSAKYVSDSKAIMERILPNTRVSHVFANAIFDNSKITISDFIETISDTFYDGGAKTPSLPIIPLVFATNGSDLSVQLLQSVGSFTDSIESVFDDTGPQWSETYWPLQHSNYSQSQLFLTPNNFALGSLYYFFDIFEIDSTQNTLVSDDSLILLIIVSSGFVFVLYYIKKRRFVKIPSIIQIYFILFVLQHSIPTGPKIEHPGKFYFLLIFYLVTTFATPYSIGHSYFGSAYGEIDDSEDVMSPEIMAFVETEETIETIPSESSEFDDTDVTQTDNVADSDAPKHFSVSLSEDLAVGDGKPTNNQQSIEPQIQQTIPSLESLQFTTPIIISESITVSDSISDKTSPTSITISESLSFSDSSSKQITISGEILLFESISLQDEMTFESFTAFDGNILLIETVLVSNGIEGVFGVASINISESISLENTIEGILIVPLHETALIYENLSVNDMISINDNSSVVINETLTISDETYRYVSIIRIYEEISLFDGLEQEFTLIPLEFIENISLLPEDTILNSDESNPISLNPYFIDFTNAITISAWVKPDYEDSASQMAIISKDMSFQILLNNRISSQQTPSFLVYDGMHWTEVTSEISLNQDTWHHIAGVINGSEITLYVDGISQGTVVLPSTFLVNDQGQNKQTATMSISENEIIIGAIQKENTTRMTSLFSGQISDVIIYKNALDTDFINDVKENTSPYSKTQIALVESISISDFYKLIGADSVHLHENVSFSDDNDILENILPIIISEDIDLLGLDPTLDEIISFEGEEFVTVSDVIPAETDSLAISAWIRPDFDVGSPQYTVVSKENSFNLFVSNILEPTHTAGFSVFDGITWNTITGITELDERWHHIIALVDGSVISLYVDGVLEGKTHLEQFSITDRGQFFTQDSQISLSDSDIVIGAYVSTVRSEVDSNNKFAGDISTVDVYLETLSSEQIQYKYQEDSQQYYKTVSLNEIIEIGDELFDENSFHIILEETLTLLEFTGMNDIYSIEISENLQIFDELLTSRFIPLPESVFFYDNVNSTPYSIISLDEIISFQDGLLNNGTNSNFIHLTETLTLSAKIISFDVPIQLVESISFYDIVSVYDPYDIHLTETLTLSAKIISFDVPIQLVESISFYDDVIVVPSRIILLETISINDDILALNPFVPSVNPEIKMVKSGFLITENPQFEIEYYSEEDAAKIDHQEIIEATQIANQVSKELASTQMELLARPGFNEIITAIEIIGTNIAISQLESQVENILGDNPQAIELAQNKIEQVIQSIDSIAQSLEDTHLEHKASEIEQFVNAIKDIAEINEEQNQTGIWSASDETIYTKIISPDGTIFTDNALFEKQREGKFDVEILSEINAKPGIYTVQSVITVNDVEYTINAEFAWGLVSLNTKKSTYYPGETAEFEIVVLNSVGNPVCNASLVMSINDDVLSSGNGIIPNSDCGIYDAKYLVNVEGTYDVQISAIAQGIQTGFETTFDVASYVEFDVIRTAQSKIDPVNNPNSFDVVIDVTSFVDTDSIEIVESIPSVFDIVTDGVVTTNGEQKTITWNKILDDDSTSVSYSYSVPFVFPELYPLGEVVINYGDNSFTEARPWFVANDPYNMSGVVEINSSTTNGPVLIDEDNFGYSVANIGDLNGDGVNDIAVGARYDDEGGSNRGAIHIMFMNIDGSVDSTVEINSSTTNGPTLTDEDYFGWSVANIGDLNGDGVNDIAVGAVYDDMDENDNASGGNNRGAIHIMFMNIDGSVDSTVEINDSTTNGPVLTNSDYFGSSVANIGDLNGDGVNDFAVGARDDDEGGSDRGAIHIMFMNINGSVD